MISAEQWGYHEAHVKRMEEKTQRCWLVQATTEMDAKSVAILRKGYADMFECENPQWKVNMDKHIAKARELEESKAKDAKDAQDAKDTEVYFRSSFDTFETEHD